MITPEKIALQFHAERQILDKCLQHGGGTYTAPTYGKAVLFRQRCYSFMKKYREALQASAASPYDILILKALPLKKEVKDINAPQPVSIEVRSLDGEFTAGDGEAVETPGAEDDFLSDAMDLAKDLGLR
jgi:hypothetical protein